MIRKQPKQEGFTLIELLVVVVIIGILASVAIPNFMGAQDKAKNSGVQSNAHSVQMAIEQYGVDNSSAYPVVLNAATAGSLWNSAVYGSGYPRTAWNTQQASTSEIAASAADVPVGQGTVSPSAAGSNAAPTTTAHYGAIAYLKSGTANDRYDLSGIGKQGGLAVCVSHVKNY